MGCQEPVVPGVLNFRANRCTDLGMFLKNMQIGAESLLAERDV